MESVYLFHVRHKKYHFSRFQPDFQFLVKSKIATIVGDITGLPQRHHPQNVPHLVKKIKGFPLKVESFQNTPTYRKLRGGVPSNPPCTTVGV